MEDAKQVEQTPLDAHPVAEVDQQNGHDKVEKQEQLPEQDEALVVAPGATVNVEESGKNGKQEEEEEEYFVAFDIGNQNTIVSISRYSNDPRLPSPFIVHKPSGGIDITFVPSSLFFFLLHLLFL